MIENIAETKLHFIDFNISPINKRIQMTLIKDRATFDSLLKQFDGHPFSVKSNLRYEANLYLLSNGLLLVDRYEASKANPYYLCNSFEDFIFIDSNIFIYRESKNGVSIVKYRISQEHLRIKEFLSKPSVHFLTHDKSTDQDVFRTEDNKFIVTKSVRNSISDKNNPFSVISNLFVKPEYVTDSIIYIELTMFESFETMKASGILENYNDIDSNNFKTYSKKILLPGTNEGVDCMVYNSIEGKKFRKVVSGNTSFPNLWSSFDNNEKIVMHYAESVYLQFSSKKDLDKVFEYLKKSEDIELSNVGIQGLFEDSKVLLSYNSWDKIFNYLPKFDFKEKSVDELLQILDIEMNKFFWDNLFIKEHFVEILGFAGLILNEKIGGVWEYHNSLNRPVFKLKAGGELDVISYFLEEALNQKFTGFCSIEGIVSTLIITSKLKISRINIPTN